MQEEEDREEEPTIDTDKLSYEIFSILESKFLFGYDDDDDHHHHHNNHQSVWNIPNNQISLSVSPTDASSLTSSTTTAAAMIKHQRGKICVLSIDSGGMRNLLAGKALAYLERALKTKSGNPDARIADYFDVAAGTGIGGIFTAMMFGTEDSHRPICTAEETWKLLAENGKSIYGKRTSSSGLRFLNRLLMRNGSKSMTSGGRSGGLEKMMKERFMVLTLKDTLKPVLIPCYDLSSSAPFLFSRADALETDSFDFSLAEVCCATSADPGLFSPVLMRSIDSKTKCVAVGGGLPMSNPTAAAITHVLHNKQEFPFVRGVEDILVLSLGTTGQVVEMRYEFDQVKKWKDVDWVRPMARVSSDCSAEVVDQAVAMAFGQCRSSNYVRIQVHFLS